MRRFLGMCVTPSRLVQQPSEDELVCQVGLELLDVRMPWVRRLLKGKKQQLFAMFQLQLIGAILHVILFEGFFSCALFAAVPEQHTFGSAQIVTQFSEYSSGNGSFSRFPPEEGLYLCHLPPEMAHSRRANHRSSKLGPIFCKRRGLGVLSLKYVKWLQYVCAYCMVWYYDVLWCIMMHYDASLHYDVLLWCIMIHYDSLRLIMIHCDSSADDFSLPFCQRYIDI